MLRLWPRILMRLIRFVFISLPIIIAAYKYIRAFHKQSENSCKYFFAIIERFTRERVDDILIKYSCYLLARRLISAQRLEFLIILIYDILIDYIYSYSHSSSLSLARMVCATLNVINLRIAQQHQL